MTPARWREVKAALAQALERSGEERAAFLAGVGERDRDLRREVEELLARESDVTPLTGAVASAAVTRDAAAGDAGTRVGPYRLLAPVGQGGMGVVYLARRDDGQYDARVAVKLARRDVPAEAVNRFRLERQVLAALEHPYIARLLDGGVTEDGRLYIVLEFVDGQPIDAFCAKGALSLASRLRLFRRVCAAVDYAHQRLIVHRDLKPSNVLVCADAAPRLVDFGIAKLLGPAPSQTVTVDAARFLTPGYASPEQRAGAAVTTASDVYSLGVLLHELLTGVLPVRGDGDGEEPVAMSAAAARARVAPGAAVAPAALRGDLDGIVAKAIRREPEARYSSVAALDDDLRRFLEGEPVRARRSTLAYRTRKFVRRHALGVGAVAAVTLSLTSGAALVALEARATARAQRIAARRGEFLEQVLRSANPAGGRRDVTVAEVLDAAARRLMEDRAEEPAVSASLLEVLAETDLALGRYTEALASADRALGLLRSRGAGRGTLSDALATRGDALRHLGRLDEAIATFREALAALGAARTTRAARAQLEDLMGIALKAAGREADAEAAYREAIALYGAEPDHGGVRRSYPLGNLSVLLGERGLYSESAQLMAEALALARRDLPLDHPDVLSDEVNYAGALMGLHQAPEAEALIRHVIEARTRILGPGHTDLLQAEIQLADCLLEQRRFAEAAAVARPAAEGLERALGIGHGMTLYAWQNFAAAACQADQAPEGLAAARRVEAAREKLYGAEDWHVASTRIGLASCLGALGQPKEAEAVLLRAVAALERARGPEFHRTQAAYAALRDLCLREGRGQDAAAWAARISRDPTTPP